MPEDAPVTTASLRLISLAMTALLASTVRIEECGGPATPNACPARRHLDTHRGVVGAHARRAAGTFPSRASATSDRRPSSLRAASHATTTDHHELMAQKPALRTRHAKTAHR